SEGFQDQGDAGEPLGGKLPEFRLGHDDSANAGETGQSLRLKLRAQQKVAGASNASHLLRATRFFPCSQFRGSRPDRSNQPCSLDEVLNYSIAVQFAHVLGAIAMRN